MPNILNNHDLIDIQTKPLIYTRPRKEVIKNDTWGLKQYPGLISIPGRITYTDKQNLVDKLNAMEPWLQDGWLYIDNHKYSVVVLQGLTLPMSYDTFVLFFNTDEYEYEAYPYVNRSKFTNTRNPLQDYNFTGTLSVEPFDQTIVVEPWTDNFITGNFSCINHTIYNYQAPTDFTINGTEVIRQYDNSI